MKAKYTFELYSSFPAPVMAELAPLLRLVPDDSYELNVIDLKQQPEKYEEKKIAWSPTLIKTRPLPEERLVGSLEEIKEKLAEMLGVPYEKQPSKEGSRKVTEGPSAHREEDHYDHRYAPTVRDMGMGATAGGSMLLRDVIIEAERRRARR